MYVTRPLSRYLADPKAAAEPPPEGPGSGFLVVVDEATEQASTRCCGLCLDRELHGLPFPQNRGLVLRQGDAHPNLETFSKFLDCFVEIVSKWNDLNMPGRAPGAGNAGKIPEYVLLVPAVGQPLSSRRYYVVRGADGKHTGKVSACSREEDKTACCFCSCVNDAKPRALDRADVYQQVEVQQLPSAPGRNKGFKAVAVATDGIPPSYLRNKGWKVSTVPASRDDDLADDAHGVDSALRRRMPDLGGGAEGSSSSSPPVVVVGRWYVPFMFVKADGEYRRLKDQFRKCKFYQMTMEQSWEQIYIHTRRHQESSSSEPAEVTVTATVRRATALLGGTGGDAVAVQEGGPEVEGGAVWFRPAAAAAATVVLDTVVWERMRWEVERGGWVTAGDGDDEERIERVERRDGQWRQFGCYLLVERFVLRRMDGSVALTCEFRHTDKIRAKWV